jgi:hypothetical protein
MKNKNKPQFRYLLSAVLVAFFAAAFWSCKDDSPTLADLRNDKITYLADSLRISDSLTRVNAAGVVNYAINVVSGSTSSIYSNYNGVGRSQGNKAVVADAIVTISQFGKIVKDTTDASGMVVFNGFFRSAVNVTIEKAGFTTVSYISAVSISDSTENNSISFVGNIIPIFETTGANTATISGKATIQTDLTNKTRELVPDGTTISASIDATNGSNFANRFLTDDLVNGMAYSNTTILYAGEILQAAYSTGIIGTVTNGNYTITVPSAIDGLPLNLHYSEIAADQKLFEQTGIIPGDRIATYRTLFMPDNSLNLSSIPAGSPITITIESVTSPATATATVTAGAVSAITVGAQGSGYTGAPIVQITGGGGGTGATANAVLTDGRVTAINVISGGTGYTSAPVITLISGSSATAFASVTDGAISAITVSDGGFNYTAAPRVIITAAFGGGATGTATVAGGKVTGITVNAGGAGYLDGNTPGVGGQEGFTATKGSYIEPKTGLKYINDLHYGTGARQPN